MSKRRTDLNMHTYTLMPYTHKYCSLKKSTAQLHNCTHTLNYRPNWKIENFEYA